MIGFCSCKCGEERADVQYSRTRLFLTYITINLIAAALGVNVLAYDESGSTSKTFERTSITQETKSGNSKIIQTYDLTDNNVCSDVEDDANLDISKSDCESIIAVGSAWTGMGVLAILILVVVLGLLLRIECRKLCSKTMRLIMLLLISIAWLFILIAWGVILGSEVLDTFTTVGSSFGVMVCANIMCSVLLGYSIADIKQAISNGPAPQANY